MILRHKPHRALRPMRQSDPLGPAGLYLSFKLRYSNFALEIKLLS